MPQISLSAFADRIHEILPVVMRGFFKRQADEISKGKITLPQFLVMDSLNRRGESKMKDLARFMDVTTAAMTGIVDRLVRDGYARRVYDSSDRRIIRVRLTPRGHATVKRIYRTRREMIIEIFGKISQDDREDYLRVLTRIKEILTQEKKA